MYASKTISRKFPGRARVVNFFPSLKIETWVPGFEHDKRRLAYMRCSCAQGKPEASKSQKRNYKQHESGDAKGAAPWVHSCNLFDLRRGRVRHKADLPTNAIDLFPCLANQGLDFAPRALAPLAAVALARHISSDTCRQSVFSFEAQQHAQAVDFETIGRFLRVLTREQRAEIIEEDFPGAVVAEHFLLHRA